MSEPDVEAVIEAAAKRNRSRIKPADPVPADPPAAEPTVTGQPAGPVPVQPVTLQAMTEPVVADDDPQIVNLMRVGLTAAEARKLVTDQRRMW